jgi:uncharacterized protein (DUF2062 family)/2-polyprenyl-3-methyl-5-hydroxy-6-metoxy-1,4-benzoquinol methylase
MSAYFSRIAGDVAELRAAMARQDTGSARGLLRLHRQIMGALDHLVREHSGKRQIFTAIVVGMVVGCTPLFGLHLLLCIMAAMALRLNKFVVYLAANISIPPLIPLLAFLSIQTAHVMAHGSFMPMDHDTLYQHRFDFIVYWLLGAVPVGLVLGAVTGAVTVLVMGRLHRKNKAEGENAANPSDAFRALTRELHRAFLPGGRMAAGFAQGKSAGDPVYRMVVDAAAGARRFIDIGGGQGLLSLLVALKHGTPALVADYDERKLASGRQAAAVLGLTQVTYSNVDVFAEPSFPDGDLIACIDVLHYQPVDRQRILVAKMARALPPGGRLFIRDMDADHEWRTRWTLLQERFSLLFSLTIASGLYPRSGGDLVRQLQSEGLSVEVRRAWGWTPFSNTLFIARRV